MFLESYFKKGKNATVMQKKKKKKKRKKKKKKKKKEKMIGAMYGEGSVIDGLCQKWFVRFEHFSLDDAPRSVDQLKLTVIQLRH